MLQIKKLTPKQESAMVHYAQRWIAECLRSGTTNRDWARAERGIRASYRAAGLAEPRVIVRTTSPLACVLAGPIAASIIERGAVRDSVRDSVAASVTDSVDASVRGPAGDNWYRYNGGSLWAAWCAWRLFFIDVCGLELEPKIAELAETWRDLSTGAGWWWPHKDFCIVAPRHDEIHQDDFGRLHCAKGPALRYPDGFSIWSWHGIQVPREWIERPKEIDPAVALNWENIEQRRCAAEIVGWDRLLQQLSPTVIDTDHDPMVGELLCVDLPDAPRQQFLKVLCGTGRTFVLPCVRNDFKTALDANAASWGENGVDPKAIRDRQWRT